MTDAPATAPRVSRPGWCAATVLSATVVSTVMQNFLTISLPEAFGELGGMGWYGWVPAVYLLASTLLIPPFAALTDRYGPRFVHMGCMAVWALGTVGASQAASAPALLACRFVQGAGAAGIVPAGLAALAFAFHDRYGRIVGVVGAVQVGAILVSAPLGGWLCGLWGWRPALLLAACLALVPMGLAPFALPVRGRGDRLRVAMADMLGLPGARGRVVQTMLLAGISFAVDAYLPLLLGARFGLSTTMIGVLSAPGLVGVGLGSVLGGWFAESTHVLEVSWAMVCAGLLLTALPGLFPVVLGAALAAGGVGLGLPSLLVGWSGWRRPTELPARVESSKRLATSAGPRWSRWSGCRRSGGSTRAPARSRRSPC